MLLSPDCKLGFFNSSHEEVLDHFLLFLATHALLHGVNITLYLLHKYVGLVKYS